MRTLAELCAAPRGFMAVTVAELAALSKGVALPTYVKRSTKGCLLFGNPFIVIDQPPDPSTWFANFLAYPQRCTRCGRPTYRVEVTTPADTGRRYVRGCDCHPRPPHDPITESNPL